MPSDQNNADEETYALDAQVLDAATRVLRSSGIMHDMRTLGSGVAAFVLAAEAGGLERQEALELSIGLIADLVDSALHAEVAHDDDDEAGV